VIANQPERHRSIASVAAELRPGGAIEAIGAISRCFVGQAKCAGANVSTIVATGYGSALNAGGDDAEVI